MKSTWMRALFSFSRTERNGIIGLLFVIFILILVGKLIPLFIPSEKYDFPKWEAEVNAWLAESEHGIPAEYSLHPVPFNPNEVDSFSLANMGLPSTVVSNWVKYLAKGGRFRNKEGVRKIFGMTHGIWDQLDSFILIPPVKMAEVRTGSDKRGNRSKRDFMHDTIIGGTYREKKPVSIQDLNSTDSLHLIEIPGIGPVFASRIISYRKLLGGYFAVSQLREVYGMREENFKAVSSYFTTDPSTLKTFNINFSTIQELGRHPYIGFRAARKIFQLRDKLGKFSSPDDLAPVVSSDSLKRLIPYLKFNQ